MASFVNACVFTAASAGTGSFVVSAAVTGWMTPAQASAVNGATYRYRAYSSDLTQWEIGTGTYTSSGTTLTRTVTASSNSNTTVNFTAAPSVALTSFGADISSDVAITGGTVTGLTNLTLASGAATPATNDAAALGTTSLMWSDLFLADGGVINFNNGDVTITQSTDVLSFAGAATGYYFTSTGRYVGQFRSTDAGASVGPILELDRFSASPADADALGQLSFLGRNSANAIQQYAYIGAVASAVTSGAENGDMVFGTVAAGTAAQRMRLYADGGFTIASPTGASKGSGTINTTGLYKNGNDVTIGTITFIIDGGGVAITTGIKGDLTIPFACTINEWTLLADQSGSIVVDIWKDTYANYPPTVADTITASAKPTITTATKGQSSTLTGWTTAIAAGDTLRFNVDSITTCQRVTLSLKVTRS